MTLAIRELTAAGAPDAQRIEAFLADRKSVV